MGNVSHPTVLSAWRNDYFLAVCFIFSYCVYILWRCWCWLVRIFVYFASAKYLKTRLGIIKILLIRCLFCTFSYIQEILNIQTSILDLFGNKDLWFIEGLSCFSKSRIKCIVTIYYFNIYFAILLPINRILYIFDDYYGYFTTIFFHFMNLFWNNMFSITCSTIWCSLPWWMIYGHSLSFFSSQWDNDHFESLREWRGWKGKHQDHFRLELKVNKVLPYSYKFSRR